MRALFLLFYTSFTMKFLNRYKSERALGVFIDMAQVQLLEISRKNEKFTLCNCIAVDLPMGAMQGKAIADLDLVSDTLKKALDKLSPQTTSVITAIHDAFVITKTIHFDNSLSTQDIAAHLQLAGQDYLQFPLRDLYFDFQTIAEPTERGKQTVQIIAAKRSEIDQRVAAIKNAGLAAHAVDVESFAIARMLSLLAPSQSVLFLSVCCGHWQLLLFAENGKLIYQTEKHKPVTNTQEIVAEIYQEINVLTATQLISRIYYSGDITQFSEITMLLENKIKSPIILADPLQITNFSAPNLEQPLCAFITTCGLALWQFM